VGTAVHVSFSPGRGELVRLLIGPSILHRRAGATTQPAIQGETVTIDHFQIEIAATRAFSPTAVPFDLMTADARERSPDKLGDHAPLFSLSGRAAPAAQAPYPY
jgi:hypothetical protein